MAMKKNSTAKTKVAKKVAPKRATTRATAKKTKRWSANVTETSDAMTLEDSIFKKSPRAIALSLKRSAEKSHRRKSAPFRSAMSMLTFYINRAGKNLPAARLKKLTAAKRELRKVFHREPA